MTKRRRHLKPAKDVTRRLRRRRRPRSVPPAAVPPILMTLGNLIAGFAAIYYATKPIGETAFAGWSTLTLAGALVFLGMFFDAVDGSLARLTRGTSDLGAQLDSLADMVAFGVAPAFIMLRLVSHYVGPTGTATILGPEADNAYAKVIWGIAAVYVACAALRLARFNAETSSASIEDHSVFRGLPSPGAAGAVASLTVLHQHLLATRFTNVEPPAFEKWTALGVPFVTLLAAFAMVSSVPYVHVINRYVRGRRDFAAIVRIVVPIALAIWWLQVTMAVAFTAYALSGPVRLMLSRGRQRHATALAIAAASEVVEATANAGGKSKNGDGSDGGGGERDRRG
ncbi:MAG: CDP-alcohol phosphatidyltransferase family protein [Phycisphaerales bacterium]|nr:CDP-alcohol phosphatidyltransferase family protein [Phycisphaerales bacterium]